MINIYNKITKNVNLIKYRNRKQLNTKKIGNIKRNKGNYGIEKKNRQVIKQKIIENRINEKKT